MVQLLGKSSNLLENLHNKALEKLILLTSLFLLLFITPTMFFVLSTNVNMVNGHEIASYKTMVLFAGLFPH